MTISGMDGLGDGLGEFERQALDAFYEDMAQEVAQGARDNGLSSADSIELETTSDDPTFVVDEARVKRRANEILAAG